MAGFKLDDMSMSKMSDTASKVANLETRFDQMENQFSSSFARLESILSGLGTQGLHCYTAIMDELQLATKKYYTLKKSHKELVCHI
jgi:hypothetical protein